MGFVRYLSPRGKNFTLGYCFTSYMSAISRLSGASSEATLNSPYRLSASSEYYGAKALHLSFEV